MFFWKLKNNKVKVRKWTIITTNGQIIRQEIVRVWMQTHTTGAERRKNLQRAWKWARENVHNKLRGVIQLWIGILLFSNCQAFRLGRWRPSKTSFVLLARTEDKVMCQIYRQDKLAFLILLCPQVTASVLGNTRQRQLYLMYLILTHFI